jgi:hypothetical protein
MHDCYPTTWNDRGISEGMRYPPSPGMKTFFSDKNGRGSNQTSLVGKKSSHTLSIIKN